jgi:hypothetical protein
MEAILGPVIKSLVDLSKFWVTNVIDTGNKAQDSLIVVVILSIITVLSSKDIYSYLALWISNYGLDCCFDNTDTTKIFIGLQHSAKHFLSMSMVGKKVNELYIEKQNLFGRTTYILFAKRGKFVGTNGAYLYCTDRSTYEEFMGDLEKRNIQTETSVAKNEKLHIKKYNFLTGGTLDYPLFEDRNFNNIISKHKETIINFLDNFKNVSQGMKKCIGTHNIGFMFHGKPGCGKTMFIKCIANYLKRDIFVVDMRTIKTAAQFEGLFTTTTVMENIFVLDEFDCVSDVIAQRGSEYEGKDDSSSRLKTLKKNLADLLTIQNKDSTVLQAIQDVQKSIKDVENGLTLDSILTLLDGVYEMRGRVIVASTNFINRIDKALLRPGRFDVVLELGEMEEWEVKGLIELCQELSENDKQLLRETAVKNKVFTPAEIINICSSCRTFSEILATVKC